MFSNDVRILLKDSIIDLLNEDNLKISYRKISYKKAKDFYRRFNPDGDNDVAWEESCLMLKEILNDGGSLYGAMLIKSSELLIAMATLAPLDMDIFLTSEDLYVPNDIRAGVKNKDVFIIQNVFTAPKYRKIGVANNLIKKIIKDNKAFVLMLYVDEDNHVARKVYESVGFVEAWEIEDSVAMFYF